MDNDTIISITQNILKWLKEFPEYETLNCEFFKVYCIPHVEKICLCENGNIQLTMNKLSCFHEDSVCQLFLDNNYTNCTVDYGDLSSNIISSTLIRNVRGTCPNNIINKIKKHNDRAKKVQKKHFEKYISLMGKEPKQMRLNSDSVKLFENEGCTVIKEEKKDSYFNESFFMYTITAPTENRTRGEPN